MIRDGHSSRCRGMAQQSGGLLQPQGSTGPLSRLEHYDGGQGTQSGLCASNRFLRAMFLRNRLGAGSAAQGEGLRSEWPATEGPVVLALRCCKFPGQGRGLLPTYTAMPQRAQLLGSRRSMSRRSTTSVVRFCTLGCAEMLSRRVFSWSIEATSTSTTRSSWPVTDDTRRTSA